MPFYQKEINGTWVRIERPDEKSARQRFKEIEANPNLVKQGIEAAKSMRSETPQGERQIDPALTEEARRRVDEISDGDQGNSGWLPNQFDVNAAVDMATMSVGRPIAAAVNTAVDWWNDEDRSFQDNRDIINEQHRIMNERANYPLPSQIAGAVMTPSPYGKVKGVANTWQAIGRGIGRSATEAAAMTAIQGAAQDKSLEDIAGETAMAGAASGVVGGLGHFARAGFQKIANDPSQVMNRVREEVPDAAAQIRAAKAAEQAELDKIGALEARSRGARREAVHEGGSMAGRIADDEMLSPVEVARQASRNTDEIAQERAARKYPGEKGVDVETGVGLKANELSQKIDQFFDETAEEGSDFGIRQLQELKKLVRDLKTQTGHTDTQLGLSQRYQAVERAVRDNIAETGTDAQKAAWDKWAQSNRDWETAKLLEEGFGQKTKYSEAISNFLNDDDPRAFIKALNNDDLVKAVGISPSAVRGAKAQLKNIDDKQFNRIVNDAIHAAFDSAASVSDMGQGHVVKLQVDIVKSILGSLGSLRGLGGQVLTGAGSVAGRKAAVPTGRLTAEDSNEKVKALIGAQ